jgi:glycosyltransferase involved in cell wall biosynthesis
MGPHGGWSESADCHFINWYTPELLTIARKILQHYKISHLWLEYSYMSTYAHLAHESGAKLILSLHNLEHRLIKEMQEQTKNNHLNNYGSWEAVKILEDEAIILADKLIVTTDEDAQYCNQMASGSEVCVAPNIINMNFALDASTSPSKGGAVFNILFVGDGNYLPNEDGIQWLIQMVNEFSLKIKNLKVFFTVVGKGTEKYGHQINSGAPIECMGYVESLDEIYATADACILPLRMGGGSRLKAYEAIKYSKPILTTRKGIEGIRVEGIKNFIYYFEDPTELLDAIRLTLSDKKNKNFSGMSADYSIWYMDEQHRFIDAINDVLG